MASKSNEGAVEMWDRGDVPGVACQGAGEEIAGVVDQMADNHIDNFLGKFVCGGTACNEISWQNVCREKSLNPGFGSIPNSYDE